jgi:two-component system sensor histidine kinase PhoQ
MSSLSGRLLLFVSLLLVVFFGLTILVLDLAFRDLSERSQRELLEAQLMALVAASDADEAGWVQPSRPLGEPRFAQPGSGLYARIGTAQGERLWSSQSALGVSVDFGGPVSAGQRRFERRELPAQSGNGASASQVMVLSAGFDWEIRPGASRNLVFSVAASLAPYEAQLQRFRGQLFGWFSMFMAALLLALALLLRLVLAPLRRIERQIGEVESGQREQLGAGLPRELVGLAANMNTLLTSERKRVERYRNTLGNLAHSLKTPLAVIRSNLDSQGDPAARETAINQQIDRMDTIVRHQLKRATASAGAALGHTAVEMKPLLVELRAALGKVYARKDLAVEIDVPGNAVFLGDRGDAFELAGNLLDNACKWCRQRVRVSVTRADDDGRRLLLTVEDDGPGIDAGDRRRILDRGTRTDERVDGQGIGLSMVREVVELYGGDIRIDASPLGGARVTVRLPGR